MAILRDHVPYYEAILRLPGMLDAPLCVFGVQDNMIPREQFDSANGRTLQEQIRQAAGRWKDRARATLGLCHTDRHVPSDYALPTLGEIIRRRGCPQVEELDLFDPRASLRFDMNQPVPTDQNERYASFIDIGSIEHVFDTRQCLENCLRMVRPGGYYVVHTPCKGYFAHGLHTFNPELFTSTLTANGFEVVYYQLMAHPGGAPVKHPRLARNMLLWLAARKLHPMKNFVHPQQLSAVNAYSNFPVEESVLRQAA